jgi:hypothetical protein
MSRANLTLPFNNLFSLRIIPASLCIELVLQRLEGKYLCFLYGLFTKGV